MGALAMAKTKIRAMYESRTLRAVLAAVVLLCSAPRPAAAIVQQVASLEFDSTTVSGLVQSTALNAAPDEEIPVIVSYVHGTPPKDGTIGVLGGAVSRQLTSIDGYALEATPAELEALAADPDVEWVALDAELRANLDLGRVVNGVPPASSVLSIYTGAGITVAILDSGIAAHPDLMGRVVARVDMVSDGPVASSESTVTAPLDPFGHGTHVAGIVAADGLTSRRVYRGVAPGARLVS